MGLSQTGLLLGAGTCRFPFLQTDADTARGRYIKGSILTKFAWHHYKMQVKCFPLTSTKKHKASLFLASSFFFLMAIATKMILCIENRRKLGVQECLEEGTRNERYICKCSKR